MPEPWRKPFASTPTVHRRMQQQLRAGTRPEMALRRELHRAGLRYFVDRRPIKSVPRRADLVFPRSRTAVFVDGCFWHGCPQHGRRPTTNSWYWTEKIATTSRRDSDTDRLLSEAGWQVIRIWEHDNVRAAAELISATVRRADLTQTVWP